MYPIILSRGICHQIQMKIVSSLKVSTKVNHTIFKYSENLRKVNHKFDIDRIGPFGRFQCKLEFKQTRKPSHAFS